MIDCRKLPRLTGRGTGPSQPGLSRVASAISGRPNSLTTRAPADSRAAAVRVPFAGAEALPEHLVLMALPSAAIPTGPAAVAPSYTKPAQQTQFNKPRSTGIRNETTIPMVAKPAERLVRIAAAGLARPAAGLAGVCWVRHPCPLRQGLSGHLSGRFDLGLHFFAFVLALVGWLQQRHDPPLKNVAADEVLAGYRERLHRQAQTLPIDAIFDPEDAPEGCDAVRLMDIYVPMDLVERAATEINERRFREWSLLREAKARPVREQLAQAIAQARGGVRAVLVADAGMGKSSVVGDLIHCCLEPERAEAQAATFRGRALLRLDLRRLASAAADPGFGRRGSAPFWDAVIAELGDELGGNNGGRADSEAAVRQLCGALQNHGLVLLDGLDEVLDPEPRRRVADLVQQLGRELGPGCAILVTARPYVYPEAALRDFRVWQLQPLSVDRPGQGSQAEALVVNWHRALAPRADPGELVESLLTEPERAVLAARPLLLTLLVALALARRTDGARPLPRRRDQLMEQATELFVRRWFQRIERDGPGQLTPALLAALDQGLLRRVLEQLSLEAQQDRREPARGDGGEAVQVEVWSSQFLGVLQDELPTDLRRETDTHAFSRIVVERAGLLFPRGGDVRVRFGYAHRQFSGYLALNAPVYA